MNDVVILNQEKIDPVSWDALVTNCDGSIYNTYQYLSSCGETWEALVVIIDSKYICATPIHFRIKAGIKYIYQPPYIPFYEILNIGGEDVHKKFINNLNIHLSAHKYIAKYFLRDDRFTPVNGFKIVEERGYHLPLNDTYETIFKSYSKGRKAQVKQAKRNGQEIIQSEDLELFLVLHEEHTLPKIHLISKWQYAFIKKLYRNLSKGYSLEISFCQQNDKLSGGIIVLKFLSRIYYLDSFSTEAGRKHNSVTLLIDHVIQQNLQTQYKFFDLGLKGTEGIEDFKRSFGATEYKITQVYKNSLPWYIKIPKVILNSLGVATAK